MKRKITIYTTLITAIALIVMFIVNIFVTKNNNYKQAENSIKTYADTFSQMYDGDNSIVNNAPDSIRITIIDKDGNVLADSKQVDISTMENHLGREEIQSALNGSNSIAIRKSDTLNTKLMYYAEKVEFQDSYVFIRFSEAIEDVDYYVLETLPTLLIILFIVLILVAIVCSFLGNKAIAPYKSINNSLKLINDGKFTPTIATSPDDEINEIINNINDIGEQLQSSLISIKKEHSKLNYILDNISDGIIVFDEYKTITLLNKSACEIFNCTHSVEGRSIEALTDNKYFYTNICTCIENNASNIFDLANGEEFYICNIKNTENFYILVLSNVTFAKKNEQLRSEFFANASHELKTPLTSIKGFNEMMSLQNKDNSLTKYINQIEQESTRMLNLIQDMLKLSNIENKKSISPENINLVEICEEIINEISPIAQKKHINISICGDTELLIERDDAYQLLKNLIENAVKYNNDNGWVKISLSSTATNTSIIVEDNGIGIDSTNQSRIFERFYRVEKSRSRETGGTGLGLSIVKHISELYNATISLNSILGKGTIITINFPIIKEGC